MADQELIAFLWDTGHFWNRAYPDVLNVTQADLPALTLQDRVVQFAVASFQAGDANIYPLVMANHKRAPLFDGIAGPATLQLAGLPRCPLPDFPPPPGATFHYDDPGLTRAVASMQRAATGSGSWPAGCHGSAAEHQVKISYDPTNMSSQQRDWLPEVKRRSAAAVADVGVKLIEVAPGQGNISVYGKVLPGNIIGMAEFNSGACGDTVFCQLNPNYAPDLDMFLTLLLHENGHNWNLEHRSGNIMNPSILRVTPKWIDRPAGYQDNSYPTLRRFFGGEPLTPLPPPPPPQPPPTSLAARRVNGGWKGEGGVNVSFQADFPAGITVIQTVTGSASRPAN